MRKQRCFERRSTRCTPSVKCAAFVIEPGTARRDAEEALCDWLHEMPVGWEHGPRHLGPFTVKRVHHGVWSVAWGMAVHTFFPTTQELQAHEAVRAILDHACRSGGVEHVPRLSNAQALRILEGGPHG